MNPFSFPPLTFCVVESAGVFFTTLQANHLSQKMGIDSAHSTSKKLEVNMFFSGCVISFIIGIAFGIVLSTVILFGNRLKQLGEESSEK
jgi:hypothetical protein